MQKQLFFNNIRKSLFGHLSEDQVKGMEAILNSCFRNKATIHEAAYSLATAYHEVGGRMVPVREGFAKTNQGAVNAVTKLYKRGVISRNYALPDGPYNKNYYGRGFVQITWYDNYLRLGKYLGIGTKLAENPDMALEYDFGSDLLVVGIIKGLYRKNKFSDYVKPNSVDYYGARNIINGDTRKHGSRIASYAKKFETALRAGGYEDSTYTPEEPETIPVPPLKPVVEESTSEGWVEIIVNIIKALFKAFGGK